jgi:hypothetical protein
MAYVKNPLHSQSASGQLAKTLTFQTYKRRTYVKKYSVPGNTPGHEKMNQTTAQLALQARTKELMQHWPDISPTDQATWNELAARTHILPINAYLRENFRLAALGQPDTDTYPAPDLTAYAIVTNPDPEQPTNPDVTGLYERVDDLDGRKVFARLPTHDYFIAHHVTFDSWQIRDSYDDSETTVAYENANDYPNDTYWATTGADGVALVTNFPES